MIRPIRPNEVEKYIRYNEDRVNEAINDLNNKIEKAVLVDHMDNSDISDTPFIIENKNYTHNDMNAVVRLFQKEGWIASYSFSDKVDGVRPKVRVDLVDPKIVSNR